MYALLKWADQKTWTGRALRSIFRYLRAGTGKMNHDLFQAGRIKDGKSGDNAPGYTWACGFLCRNGTYLTGTGLCDPGDQWCRWGAGTHAYALETAQKISDTDVHIHQLDGSDGNG